jgi:hypothetical protein
MSNIDYIFTSDGYYSCGSSMNQYTQTNDANIFYTHAMYAKSHINNNEVQMRNDTKKIIEVDTIMNMHKYVDLSIATKFNNHINDNCSCCCTQNVKGNKKIKHV